MKLTCICNSCNAESTFKPKFSDRGLLQEKLGDEVKVNCTICGKLENKHINKLTAKEDSSILILVAVLAVVVDVLTWFYIGFAASLILFLSVLPLGLMKTRRQITLIDIK
ncbi:hypothetical protein [Patiriisocius sp. Uisw_047]|jgi:hypothetical protein|uniref:hypothetical protein n=1 Tax=Patiriisocius sp. Uisw_047 TaxID=3230969 RepID=UPI0039EC7153